MPNVEILYFPGCPNVPAARDQLRRALEEVGKPAEWSERDVTASETPPELRGYGSPTILVDGRDVTGDSASGAASCRLYLGSDVPGVPALETIKAALVAAGRGATGAGDEAC